MKQIYLIICSVFLTVNLFGQTSNLKNVQALKTVGKASIVKPFSNNGLRSMVPFYTEDFGGGIPATWTQNPSPAGALWTYDTDGSNGAFASPNDPILSPTSANGFMIFDSDYLDNGGDDTNFGGGPAPAPHMGIITTDAINCSGKSTVQLEFYQYYRVFSALSIIGVSNDGVNFVYDTINTAIDVNDATPNADKVQLNISSVAANQPTVYVQFIFDGTPVLNGFSGYYFWQVDDISLSELPVNDLKLETASVFNSKLGNYYRIPQDHVDTMSFQGAIFNYGSANQSNVTLNVSIDRDGANVYNEDSVLTTFTTQTRDTLLLSTVFLPAAIGTYTGVMTLSSDSAEIDMTNNIDTFAFATTDTIYSLDQGNISSYLGTNSWPGSSDQAGFKIANLYEMIQADTATSVTFFVSPSTTKGAQINIQILSPEGIYNQNPEQPPLHSESYTIPDTINKSTGSLLTATLNNGKGVPLEADSAYYIALEMTGGGDTVRIADDETLEQHWASSMIYLLQGGSVTAPGWYSNGNGFIIRLNLGNVPVDTTGTNDKILNENISMYPNPTQDNLTINWAGNVNPETIEVTNVLGDVIYLNRSVIATKKSVNINTAHLNNGIYFVKMSANNQIITRKIVVNK